MIVRQLAKQFKENFTSFEELRLFFNIFMLLTILPLFIKVFSIPRLMYIITPNGKKKYGNMSIEKLKRKLVKYTDYILGLNIFIYKPKCLKRSIVLYRYLRGAGLDVKICFGVRINKEKTEPFPAERLEGHAWLEYRGDIFLEKDREMAKTYKMTYCFPNKNYSEVTTTIFPFS